MQKELIYIIFMCIAYKGTLNYFTTYLYLFLIKIIKFDWLVAQHKHYNV